MGVTTWDGHLRIDLLRGSGVVSVSMLTVEAVTEIELRPGLVVAFVTTDELGPPALVEFALADGMVPPEVTGLLGPRLAGAITDLLGGTGPGGWLRLDLVEVDDLAAAWAPYRARALLAAGAPVPAGREAAVGTWAGGLWTSFGFPGLRDLVTDRTALAFRGAPDPGLPDPGTGDPGPREPAADRLGDGTWVLPQAIVDAVGVGPEVRWSATGRPGEALTLRLTARTAGPRTLQVAIDDGAGGWVDLVPGAPGEVTATLVVPDTGIELLFRSAGGPS